MNTWYTVGMSTKAHVCGDNGGYTLYSCDGCGMFGADVKVYEHMATKKITAICETCFAINKCTESSNQ